MYPQQLPQWAGALTYTAGNTVSRSPDTDVTAALERVGGRQLVVGRSRQSQSAGTDQTTGGHVICVAAAASRTHQQASRRRLQTSTAVDCKQPSNCRCGRLQGQLMYRVIYKRHTVAVFLNEKTNVSSYFRLIYSSKQFPEACPLYWWSGVVVSALALINEVNRRRARLVLRWATVSGFNSRCRIETYFGM